MREKIWYYLLDNKFQAYYMDLCVSKYQKIDRAINIFLALISSTSVAAWAVWNSAQLVWAILIAASNVFTILKPYIPYSKYIRILNEKSIVLHNLHLEYERLWYKFDKELIDEIQATEFFFDLKKKSQDALKLGEEVIHTEDKKIIGIVNGKMKIYIKNNYNVSY